MDKIDTNVNNYPTLPPWIDNLFYRFMIIYKGLWSYNMASEAQSLAAQIEWYCSLQTFNAEIVNKAIEQCKVTYDKPPSIKQFVELCRQERDRYNFHDKKITYQEEFSSTCSPLLREYMLKNPIKEDDIFKLIFQKYTGNQRGIETMKEIKRQLTRGFNVRT